MKQCTRFYILLRIFTTSSFLPIGLPRFASFFVDPGVVVSVVFSPLVRGVVPVRSASVLGDLLTVSLLSVTTDSVLLIPSWVPFVNVVV